MMQNRMQEKNIEKRNYLGSGNSSKGVSEPVILHMSAIIEDPSLKVIEFTDKEGKLFGFSPEQVATEDLARQRVQARWTF